MRTRVSAMARKAKVKREGATSVHLLLGRGGGSLEKVKTEGEKSMALSQFLIWGSKLSTGRTHARKHTHTHTRVKDLRSPMCAAHHLHRHRCCCCYHRYIPSLSRCRCCWCSGAVPECLFFRRKRLARPTPSFGKAAPQVAVSAGANVSPGLRRIGRKRRKKRAPNRKHRAHLFITVRLSGGAKHPPKARA